MRVPAVQTEMDPIELPGTEDHVERLLDQALEATFPASDPVAVSSAAAAMGNVPSGEVGRIRSG
jgi:hypothetical protein